MYTLKHTQIFSDNKDREQCLVGHGHGHSCIKCEYCHNWIKWPYDSYCLKREWHAYTNNNSRFNISRIVDYNNFSVWCYYGKH